MARGHEMRAELADELKTAHLRRRDDAIKKARKVPARRRYTRRSYTRSREGCSGERGPLSQ